VSGPRAPFSDVASFYAAYDEASRLDTGYFALERARTRELIERHWPGKLADGGASPKVVLDVGGAAGAYAYWLASFDHEVHLLDAVAKHVAQARAAAAQHPRPLRSIRQGDARALPYADASADVVLLLGPLYHLQERADRLQALREAARALKPGGCLFAAAISRFASLLDGLGSGALLDEPAFAAIVEGDLRDGRHRNETGVLAYFTEAFFHEPEELRAELTEAGFHEVRIVAVEGPAFALPDFEERWRVEAARDTLLRFVRSVEEAPALLGASPHLLACARTGVRPTPA
jgi:ubiquinone/menaquinone biosynthesis C-methylase UbiE